MLPVFLIVGIGFLFGKKKKIDLTAINEFVIWVATPCLIISSIAKSPVEPNHIAEVFLCALAVVAGCLGVGYIVIRALGLPQRVYLPPVAFANTGNMGLPLVLFAFGDTGLNTGILYMVATTVLHYTVGIAILSYKESPFEVLKLPLIYAAGLGIVISLTGWQMPTPAFRAIDILGEASIPAMIFALGYKLSEVTMKDVGKSFFFGGIRIGVGFLIGVLSVRALGLGGTSSGVVMLDAAMPPAVFNFVLAEKYKQDSKVVASIIMAGTLLSIVTTPLILIFLL